MTSAADCVGDSALRVGYLVNEYPKVSHSFIRREIAALERSGCSVVRYSVRGWDSPLVDQADLDERERTAYLLRCGALRLMAGLLLFGLFHPRRWSAGLRLASAMSRRADRGFAYHVVYLAQAWRLLTWAQRDGVHHIHAHFGTNPAEVVMLAQALGGPSYSFTVHGPEDFDKPEFLGLTRKIGSAAFVVAISSFCRSQLMRWCDTPHWGKLRIVPCGLDESYVDRVPSAVPASSSFVCVGRLCEQKGQLLLLDAWAVLRERGLRAELVLAGDGPMRKEIESRLQALRLDDCVRITGWLSGEQVRDEIERARAMVLPSFAEGLPVVLMEAMALSRPVLSTFVAGIPELVRPGIDGWLFPAGDVQALADAIMQCLAAEPDALQQMGKQARQRALERHNIDGAAALLLGLFRSLPSSASKHAVQSEPASVTSRHPSPIARSEGVP